MKILVVQDAGWTNKGPHQQHHLMERLSLRGNEILVVGYDQLWWMKRGSAIARRNVQFHVQRFYDNADITYASPPFVRRPFLDYLSVFVMFGPEIKRAIRRFRPDVIVGFTSVMSTYWGVRFAKARGMPYIDYWTDRTDSLVPFKLLRPIARMFERRTIKKATCVLAINETLKEYIIRLGASPSVVQVLPGGVDLKKFNPGGIDGQRMRDKYGLLKDDFVLFFMGWIYEFGGLKEVVRELAKHRESHPELKLLIVGEGDFCPTLRRIVDESQMQDSVVFTGKVPYTEIPELIAAADIALLPAHNNDVMRDAVPIKLYEYLAMHKPTICTKLPGIMREFGNNSGIAYVDKPEDVVAKALSLNQQDLQILETQARQFIADYDWDKITVRFEEMLAFAVENSR